MVASPRWPSGNMAAGNFIGQVGGVATVWQPCDANLTRPSNTTAYAAGEGMGSSASIVFSFTNFFRAPGSSALLTGLRFVMNASGILTSNAGAVLAHLYQGSPSAASGLVDQSAYPTLIADDALKLGMINFTTWYQGGTGSNIIESYGSPLLAQQPVIAAPGLQTLYAVLVANGAFTPVSAAVLSLYASSIND
jgi:hypothetical protein